MGSKRSMLVKDHERHTRDGYGQGRFDKYIPYISVGSASSCACKFRIYSARFNRTFHFLSNGEHFAFLLMENNTNVVEIREQFPLDPDVTRRLSLELQIRHPAYRGEDIVMTTDFVLTVRRSDGFELKAYQIKRSMDDLNQRTHDKLKLEREYWQRRQIKWGLLLSERFNQTLCCNLKLIYPLKNLRISLSVLKWLSEFAAELLLSRPELPFSKCNELCSFDIPQYGRMPATEVVKLLTARKLWHCRRIAECPLNDTVMADFTRREPCLF